MLVELNKKKVALLAVKSLLYEVSVNPKPGLVDPVDVGSHGDMNVFTFIDSSISLAEYFEDSFSYGYSFKKDNFTELFNGVRLLGIKAERDMFKATNGINTHKGAIFSLGIIVAAVGYLEKSGLLSYVNIQTTIQKMLLGLVEHDFAEVKNKKEAELTAGEIQYIKYGQTGIRGEAEAGFPIVFNHSLPFLLQTQGSLNNRFLDTLFEILKHSEDSNLIKRAGQIEVVSWSHQVARKYFEKGGSNTIEGHAYLIELNKIFKDKNLSLGGSADLLILTIFLFFLTDNMDI